jgi:hypothetical protein
VNDFGLVAAAKPLPSKLNSNPAKPLPTSAPVKLKLAALLDEEAGGVAVNVVVGGTKSTV